MNARKIVNSIFRTVITIAILMVLVRVIYAGMNKAYDFGFRIFADEPITMPPGEDKYVGVVEGDSVMQIGQKLEENHLIRSARLFYFQEMLSSYHGKLQSGAYVLNTEMTPYEMMEIMSAGYEEKSDEETMDYLESVSGNSAADMDGEYSGSEEIGEDSGDMGITENDNVASEVEDREGME